MKTRLEKILDLIEKERQNELCIESEERYNGNHVEAQQAHERAGRLYILGIETARRW